MNREELFSIFSILELESVSHLTIVDAMEFSGAHVPPFPPDASALITGLVTQANLSGIKAVLSTVYPQAFLLKLVDGEKRVSEIMLSELGEQTAVALFVPILGRGSSLEAFQEIIAHLRAPEDGCPWDKEQTHLTLRKHLLEESYETLAAMDEEDAGKMCEEFGDLLLQIVLNAQIASESGEFTMAEVLTGIHDKIVRRHPHVFGEVEVGGVGDVLSNWESIKKEERKNKGEGDKSLLDGLPAALPALTQAQEFQSRAARVGFDWPEIEGVLDKIKEEIDEVRATSTPEELADELGDLFFALVNLARWKKIDAEAALREANLKFKRRFRYVEKRAVESGQAMAEIGLQELDNFWNEAKRQGL